MPKKKKPLVPVLIVPKNATLKQMYAIEKRAFSADDLQRFTEDAPMELFQDLIADLERIHEEESRKLEKKKSRKKKD
jgi:hypothetical protein